MSLKLDEGFLCGGFAADYYAQIIPPQKEPIVRAIAAATGTDRHPRIDVEIQHGTERPWICSFEGTEDCSSIFTTPDPLTAGLATINSPVLYLINTRTYFINEIPIPTPAVCAVSDLTNARLFVATAINLVAIGENGLLWRSGRVSLDGITMLVYSDGCIRGVGTRLGGGSIKFSIDGASGETTGGFDFKPLGPDLWFAP
ncbi:MAG: hypothetical protein WBP75_11755 [Candidatus Cybelea sp.]